MKIPSTIRWQSAGRTLGQGGQGTVSIVEDKTGEHQGEFALKALITGKPATAYVRFVREIEATKKINHPGIVKIIDHSKPDDSFHFYVMPYAEGATSLKKVLGTSENPYFGNPLAAIDLFVRMVDAIQACEAASVVHRDLSPANVLFHPDGRITIIDFGLCQVEGAEMITLVDEGVGTPNYMAPECESGSDQLITSNADLYSAAKILWAAVTNSNAFAPNEPAAWHLHHIFAKTIRHSRADRFPNAAEALMTARKVRYLVMAAYPPLELIKELCPICGWGRLTSFDYSHQVFGNPNPPGILAVQCSYCGFCFAVNNKDTMGRVVDQQKLT